MFGRPSRPIAFGQLRRLTNPPSFVQQPASPELDPSYANLIKEVGMKSGRRQKVGSLAEARPAAMQTLHEGEKLSLGVEADDFSRRQAGRLQSASREGDVEEEDYERRDERRSPAAVLGSKRVGLVILPPQLVRGIEKQISETNPREIRDAFLSLLPPPGSSAPKPSGRERKAQPHSTPEVALAKAAAFLPGQYAAVRNILVELERRLGMDWMGDDGIVEFSGGSGPGLWATLDATGRLGTSPVTKPVDCHVVHTSRYGLELGTRLIEDISESVADINFTRKFIPETLSATPSLALSTFHLSTLPTPSSRNTHLSTLLSLDAPYTILVDRSTPAGWAAISEARTYILAKSSAEDPLHVVAPCPHDGPCPLVRDICGYKQKLQRPTFLRKTKHSGRGEEEVGYCYLVVAKGERPSLRSDSGLLENGRLGGVGREEIERLSRRDSGKTELREVEGGEFEMINLGSLDAVYAEPSGVVEDDVLVADMRQEAYSWPRLVAAPMKRSGHVVMDACTPSGQIQRLTFSKSHSNQGYYDARKSSWGDLFPHESKGKEVVRTRGIKKLSKFDQATEANWPVAELMEELESSEGDQAGVESWSHGRGGKRATVVHSTFGRRREMSTFVRRVGLSSQKRYMSAHPVERESPLPAAVKPKVTINELRRMAASKTPITCLTAYDYPTSLLCESAQVDMCLIGDSLSQVALGHSSTTSITLDEMIHHCKAVTKGCKTAFLFADLPFGSFEASLEDGMRSAIRLIKEGGVDGVKIEGGMEIVPLVQRLSAIGIPVMPHIGLQPQRATSLSGYLVQGRSASSARSVLDTALAMQSAGAFGLLLEAIPHSLATFVTDKLDIPTIGIGAGPGTSGQVLVISDVLGVYAEEPGVKKAKFVRQFANVGKEARRGAEGFVEAVKSGRFPEVGSETYAMKKDEWEAFLREVEGK
ncbi:3-methyl-2-oxobutanoate hydroxymethyltransferase, partial [Tremellales sp. Uapishka_1]